MTNGNLAYKLPERYETPARKTTVKRKNKSRRSKKNMIASNRYIHGMCIVVILSLSAGFMISRFVAVNETEQSVASLRKQLADAEAVTSQMTFDMEQSIDLAKIEQEATTRLGMQRPEKYQTIYVNVKQDDMTEKTASDVEGPGRHILSVLKKLGSNIVNFFSIK